MDTIAKDLNAAPIVAAKSNLTLKNAVLLVVGCIGLVMGGLYLYDVLHTESTDDAYVAGHLHEVSPRISGVVQAVSVTDNQVVAAGDVLVRLDPADNQALYDEAKANYDKEKLDAQRNEDLEGTKAVSQQDLDHAQGDLAVAQAHLDTARLQLAYATIVAPAAGRVGRKSVEVGNRVQPGQSLLVVVEDEVWVVANFKETQLAKLQPKQPVTMTIDAIPGKQFTGSVESVAPASGNEFALLPADNSTGNFTKIVQRIPVKILFDPESIRDFRGQIRPGMSVVVKVHI